ncbi:MAG TPA: FliH/SctL family protein [Pirellulales bacterium]|jgi:flagellar assembly protein FliH|nr:FliH/SctL family protein [Pirellulales bacterium]
MASVIKSNLGTRQAAPIVFNFEEVTQQANRYVDDVQSRAAAIIAEARRQAEAVTRRAEEQGRQAALQAVEQVFDEKVEQRMDSLLPALQKVVNELVDARQAWLRHWEESAVRLAAKIAERVIRRELSQSPQITVALVREALALVAGSSHIKIALHPDDFETLSGQIDRLTKEVARAAEAEIVPDQTVSPGGCRVETRQGQIDMQIENQLKRIIAELTGTHD